jgi:acyl carrier protein
MVEAVSAKQIASEVKIFLARELLPDTEIDDRTRLIGSGYLTSIAIVKLVTFLEGQYGIEVLPHEMDEEHFDTLPRIARLVLSKRGAG